MILSFTCGLYYSCISIGLAANDDSRVGTAGEHWCLQNFLVTDTNRRKRPGKTELFCTDATRATFQNSRAACSDAGAAWIDLVYVIFVAVIGLQAWWGLADGYPRVCVASMQYSYPTGLWHVVCCEIMHKLLSFINANARSYNVQATFKTIIKPSCKVSGTPWGWGWKVAGLCQWYFT